MATANKRQAPPTHPSVWAGLGLSLVGLLLAMYAYTGTRIYDIRFALVALGGGLVALTGILAAAWGRAVMGARAQRASRTRATPASAPTVAAPESKKRFAFPKPKRREKAEKPAGAGGLFAFKPGGKKAEARAEDADASSEGGLFRFSAPSQEAAPPASVRERVTLKCPRCATQFVTEGVRPMQAECPNCRFAAQVR